MFAALLDVVLPQPCLGCGAPGSRLCESCLAGVAAPSRRDPAPCPDGLPACWSAASYEGAVRRAVIAYKERGETALSAPLADLLAFTLLTALRGPQQGAQSLLEGHGAATPPENGPAPHGATGRGPVSHGWPGGGPVPRGRPVPRRAPVVVVPVPSRRAAVRGRGHDHVGVLAERVVRRLRGHGVPARLWPALRHHRRVADQSGLGSSARVANLAGSFSVPESAVHDPGGAPHVPTATGFDPVPRTVLLDDVVTTGATLADAARALRRAGAAVPLAVTVAATRRISRNGHGDSQ